LVLILLLPACLPVAAAEDAVARCMACLYQCNFEQQQQRPQQLCRSNGNLHLSRSSGAPIIFSIGKLAEQSQSAVSLICDQHYMCS